MVVGSKHPLWEQDAVDLRDLHHHSIIMRESNSQSRVWLEDTLQSHGIQPQIGAEFDNLESMKRAVSIGVCLAVLPDYVVQAEVEQGTLRMIPIEARPFSRTLKLIWETDTQFSPITRAFLGALSIHYPALASLLNPSDRA